MLAMRALKGAGWLVFSRFVGRFIDFFTLLILARILSPADFGVAAFATSLVVIIDTILEVPVTQALVRLKTVERGHLDTGFTLGVLRSAIVAVIIFAVAWPVSLLNHDAVLLPLVSVLAIGPIAKGFSSPAMVHFARSLRFRPAFHLELASKIGACMVVAIIVVSGGTYWAIVANFAAACVVSTLFSYALAPYRPGLSLSRLSDFVGFIGWFSASQLISAFNWQFDRFLIGALSDKPSLGRYAVANDLSVIPAQSIIGPTMQPIMAAFSQIVPDTERMGSAFLRAVRFAMLIGVPACLGISLTADLVTDLLLGPQWKDAAPILSIVALSIVPAPYFQTLQSASLAFDRPHMLFRINLTDFFFRIVLLPSGFYLYSIIGISIAKVILSMIMFGFYLRATRQLLGLGIFAQLTNIWRIALAGGVMVAWVVCVRAGLAGNGWRDIIQLALISATGAIVYGVTLILLGMKFRMP